jgi:3-phosphoshikimate 1-carboxyvinyltransferase
MALPELIEIVPLDKPVRAEITVPGSKSITNRALILATLAAGEVTLTGALWSEDTQIMVECLQKLGFEIRVENDQAEFCNRTITVKGLGGKIPQSRTGILPVSDRLEACPTELFVGNAGTAARFLSAFVCLGEGVYRLSGVPRMHERPQAALFQALRELGYHVESENGNDKLPVRISHRVTESTEKKSGSVSSASLWQKKCRVSIEESSQFASALLLCAKVGNWKIEIVGENAEESPYVAMTSKLIEAFPKNGGTFQIEPDASSGSYFWATDWVLWISRINQDMNQISVKNWPDSEWQIDADYPKILKGARPQSISRETHLGDSIMTDIVVAPLNLRPAGATSSVFIFPDSPQKTSQATKMVFNDLGRLRVQECDRVTAIVTELQKCNANISEKNDTITVIADRALRLPPDKFIETYKDHRMAMCFAILGLKVPGIKIKNPACVKKTFPNFFQKVAGPPPNGLGAEIWEIKDGRRTRKLIGDDLFAD